MSALKRFWSWVIHASSLLAVIGHFGIFRRDGGPDAGVPDFGDFEREVVAFGYARVILVDLDLHLYQRAAVVVAEVDDGYLAFRFADGLFGGGFDRKHLVGVRNDPAGGLGQHDVVHAHAFGLIGFGLAVGVGAKRWGHFDEQVEIRTHGYGDRRAVHEREIGVCAVLRHLLEERVAHAALTQRRNRLVLVVGDVVPRRALVAADDPESLVVDLQQGHDGGGRDGDLFAVGQQPFRLSSSRCQGPVVDLVRILRNADYGRRGAVFSVRNRDFGVFGIGEVDRVGAVGVGLDLRDVDLFVEFFDQRLHGRNVGVEFGDGGFERFDAFFDVVHAVPQLGVVVVAACGGERQQEREAPKGEFFHHDFEVRINK